MVQENSLYWYTNQGRISESGPQSSNSKTNQDSKMLMHAQMRTQIVNLSSMNQLFLGRKQPLTIPPKQRGVGVRLHVGVELHLRQVGVVGSNLARELRASLRTQHGTPLTVVRYKRHLHEHKRGFIINSDNSTHYDNNKLPQFALNDFKSHHKQKVRNSFLILPRACHTMMKRG